MESVRLNKFISSSGFCSRREADNLIELGRVYVNNRQCKTAGMQVTSKDFVEVDGQHIKTKPAKKRVYIAFNKPVGVTCTTESKVQGNIVEFINFHEKIFPIGRLDKDSQGLIFMTNDGDIVNKILRAGNSHEKEYIVSVDGPVTDEFVRKISNGIPILDTVTKKCRVSKMGKNTFKIVLTQGLNRQIRRMCDYLGYKVTTLKRTRIMNVHLDKLKIGSWRHLTESEMNNISKMIADSSNTKEASTDTNKGRVRSRRPSKPALKKEFSKKRNSKGQNASFQNKRNSVKLSRSKKKR